ncbi:MAG: hypothetical protein HOQ24_13885 [Mycobacteriaceae bacterium]|nr:hypothetical protein [Mycobacteriaceae bacterium]
MKFTKFTAAALLATASAALAGTGVADAKPAPADRPGIVRTATGPQVRGSQGGVDYRAALSPDRRAAVTTIANGKFVASRDGRSIAVADRTGRTVATLPMRLKVADRPIALRPTIDTAGTRLSLSPIGMAAKPVRPGAAQDRFMAEAEKAAPTALAGAAIGAAIGFLVGFPAGLFIFDFITVPVTTVVGGIIGGLAGLVAAGGQPLVDAGATSLGVQAPKVPPMPK